jgi:MoxR-like ATPase
VLISDIQSLAQRLRAEIGKVIIGQNDTVDLLLTALFSGGHILLEGPPGTAKTLLARTFCQALSLRFGRIQFTPDMLPGDILGSNLFNFQTSAFTLSKGPIFCDLLLADEINRTPPKTQAALLEAMQERHVTLDGVRHDLGSHFTVIATQNPIEQQGTYPLPEAQLDRFLFKHILGYPSIDEEKRIVDTSGNAAASADPASAGVTAVLSAHDLSQAIATVAAVRLNDANLDYIVNLIRWPGRRGRGRLWTAATMSCPTTSRRCTCRVCAIVSCCRPRPRSRARRSMPCCRACWKRSRYRGRS